MDKDAEVREFIKQGVNAWLAGDYRLATSRLIKARSVFLKLLDIADKGGDTLLKERNKATGELLLKLDDACCYGHLFSNDNSFIESVSKMLDEL